MQWLSLLEMVTATYIQILDEAVCIWKCANTLEKGMDPTILRSAMDK